MEFVLQLTITVKATPTLEFVLAATRDISFQSITSVFWTHSIKWVLLTWDALNGTGTTRSVSDVLKDGTPMLGIFVFLLMISVCLLTWTEYVRIATRGILWAKASVSQLNWEKFLTLFVPNGTGITRSVFHVLPELSSTTKESVSKEVTSVRALPTTDNVLNATRAIFWTPPDNASFPIDFVRTKTTEESVLRAIMDLFFIMSPVFLWARLLRRLCT